jgi:succinate dehydrogenase subunit C
MRTEEGSGSDRAGDRPTYPSYVPKLSRWWWLRGSYRSFAAREFTSIFAGAFSVLLLLFLFALSRGREAYEGFLRWLDSPGVVVLFSAILAAMLYHTVTWFRLTSHVQVVRLGRRVVPRRMVNAAMFAVWIGVSAVVAYFHVWF